MFVLSALLVAVGLFLLAAGMVATRLQVADRPSRIDAVLGDGSPEVLEEAEHGPSLGYRALAPLFDRLGDIGRRLSPSGRVEILTRRIVYAGLESKWTAERVLGWKVGAAVVISLAGFVFHAGPAPIWLWCIGWAVFGFFVPDILLSGQADRRQAAIARDLPEALDLLAITVEAGLGLEQALQVVSEDMPGPLGDELTRLLREIELGVPRRDALAALRDRTDVDELSAFVVSLVQADTMGVAIADVLKVQAVQVRLKRRQRAREKAAQTPVKILFPVIFGVLPALFIVVIGPAVITISDNLGGR
jgi:tight adherence protein C